MIGGEFQGADAAAFASNVQTLATITSPPVAGWNTINLNNPTAFPDVRYFSPTSSYGNIAELQFFGFVYGGPIVTGISPDPVPLSPAPQTITITGQNFQTNATVDLTDRKTGHIYSTTILSQTVSQIVFNGVVSAISDEWYVSVINNGPDFLDYGMGVPIT
jgi:hypothetical protein